MKLEFDLRGMDDVKRQLQASVDRLTSLVSDTLKDELVPRTPIDTGRARRGWQQRKSAVENRVPYITALEKGRSKQAPRGFVRQAIEATVTKTKRIIK